MTRNELREKGLAMRTQLFGAKLEQRLNETAYADPMMEKFRDVSIENVFGALWTRPGLDLKTRTLVCVVTDVATGREQELALHLRMALRQGWSEEELTEAMLHMIGYVGLPLVRGAMLVASEAFAEARGEPAD